MTATGIKQSEAYRLSSVLGTRNVLKMLCSELDNEVFCGLSAYNEHFLKWMFSCDAIITCKCQALIRTSTIFFWVMFSLSSFICSWAVYDKTRAGQKSFSLASLLVGKPYRHTNNLPATWHSIFSVYEFLFSQRLACQLGQFCRQHTCSRVDTRTLNLSRKTCSSELHVSRDKSCARLNSCLARLIPFSAIFPSSSFKPCTYAEIESWPFYFGQSSDWFSGVHFFMPRLKSGWELPSWTLIS